MAFLMQTCMGSAPRCEQVLYTARSSRTTGFANAKITCTQAPTHAYRCATIWQVLVRVFLHVRRGVASGACFVQVALPKKLRKLLKGHVFWDWWCVAWVECTEATLDSFLVPGLFCFGSAELVLPCNLPCFALPRPPASFISESTKLGGRARSAPRRGPLPGRHGANADG